MLSPRPLVGIVALTVLLVGCTPSGPGESASTSTPTASPEQTTPTPEVARPAAVIVSLEGIAVQDDVGATLESATFEDPDAMLALVGELMGSTPVPIDQRKWGLFYEWPGVTLGVFFGTAWLRSELSDLGGLPLRTVDGIQVGSTRADVAALSPFDVGYDADGDGVSDLFGVEQRSVPDYPSLSYPGQPGTAFIGVQFEGDTVSALRAPSNDYTDV